MRALLLLPLIAVAVTGAPYDEDASVTGASSAGIVMNDDDSDVPDDDSWFSCPKSCTTFGFTYGVCRSSCRENESVSSYPVFPCFSTIGCGHCCLQPTLEDIHDDNNDDTLTSACSDNDTRCHDNDHATTVAEAYNNATSNNSSTNAHNKTTTYEKNDSENGNSMKNVSKAGEDSKKDQNVLTNEDSKKNVSKSAEDLNNDKKLKTNEDSNKNVSKSAEDPKKDQNLKTNEDSKKSVSRSDEASKKDQNWLSAAFNTIDSNNEDSMENVSESVVDSKQDQHWFKAALSNLYYNDNKTITDNNNNKTQDWFWSALGTLNNNNKDQDWFKSVLSNLYNNNIFNKNEDSKKIQDSKKITIAKKYEIEKDDELDEEGMRKVIVPDPNQDRDDLHGSEIDDEDENDEEEDLTST